MEEKICYLGREKICIEISLLHSYKTIKHSLLLSVRLNADIGTRTNLVSEVLLNPFIFLQVQYQTFQASCGFKFLIRCLTARVELDGLNIWLEECFRDIADGLGFIPKDDPDTCHRNFDQPQRGCLPCFGTSRGIIWIGTWRTLHPQLILHAPGAISVHSGFSPSKP